MAISGVSAEAAASLKAINAWVGIIESNLAGSQRVAFKAKQPQFTNRLNPGDLSSKVNIPSAAIEINALPINFTQGAIVASELDTDLAISGDGYFLVSDSLDNAGRNVFLTRDGQFHWDEKGYLRTASGLYVLDQAGVTRRTESDAAIPMLTDSASGKLFTERLRLRIYNPDLLVMPGNVRTDFEIDLQALIDEGKLQADLDDLRVTYWNGSSHQVLALQVDTTAGLRNAVVSFRTPMAIAVGDFTDQIFLHYGNALAPAGPQTLFGATPTAFDDFNDPVDSAISAATPRANWAVPTGPGTWVVRNANRGVNGDGDTDRELVQTTNSATETRIVYDDGSSYTWEDYTFSVTYGNNDADDDGIYIYFRFQDPNNWYRVATHTGGLPNPPWGGPLRQIQKCVNGVITTMVADNYRPPTSIPTPPATAIPAWRDSITVEVRGERIRLIHGGQVVLETFDTNPILQGTIALSNYSQGAWYDDVVVTPMPTIGTVVASHNGVIKRSGSGTDVVSIDEETYMRQAIMLARPTNQDGLMFSQYGSTVFDYSGSLAAGRLLMGNEETRGLGQIQFGALEASNVSITEFMPMLSSAQKMFAAISKVITAFNGTLDDMNALLR